MNWLEDAFTLPPFGLARPEKDAFFSGRLAELTAFHRARCAPYARMLEGLGCPEPEVGSFRDAPFLPVGLFKRLELCSVPGAEVLRTVTSSGTSGQAVSRIPLDAQTAALQQQALAAIVADFIGPARLPMLLIDCPSVLRDRAKFTARGAGLLGFSIFGKGREFLLDEEMHPDFDLLERFLETVGGKPFLLFGFTFIVWERFYKALLKAGKRCDLSGGILIHGGGWKKLIEEAVPPLEFNRRLEDCCGLRRIYNYYGMAEQVGSIFMQCEQGHYHCSLFSEVLARRAVDFSLCRLGEPGILQVLSLLPRSYPGHSLLTEDKGVLLGEDGCPCGRRGTYFDLLGRLEHAELRGCSDVYAAEHG